MTAKIIWAYFHKIWGISHLKNTLCSLFVEYCKNLQGIECCWKTCPWECQGWKSGFLETQNLKKNRKNDVFMHIIPLDSVLTTQMHFSPTHLVPLLLSTLFGGLASKLSLNNTWDETGTWGLPDVVPAKLTKKIRVNTPVSVCLDKAQVSSPINSAEHVLVKLANTAMWKSKIQRKEATLKTTTRKRCAQCLKEKRQDVRTSYVCVSCNYTHLCKPGNPTNNHDCFRRWHVARAQAIRMHQKDTIVPVATL